MLAFSPVDEYSYYPNSYVAPRMPSSYGSYDNFGSYPTSAARERERYLHALADEQAARSSYANALARERRRAAEQVLQQEALRRQQAQRASPFFTSNPFGAVSIDPFGFRRSPSPVDDFGANNYDEYVAAHRQREADKRERERVMQEERLKKLQEQQAAARERARKVREQEADGYDDLLAGLLRGQRSQQHQQTQQQRRPNPSRSPLRKEKKEQTSPKSTTIPITEPERKPSVADKEALAKQESAASTIQSLYRTYSTRRKAHSTLASITTRFETLRSGFVFPFTLDFNESAPSVEDTVPPLQYTHNNAPVHAYEDGLVKLLQALDAVESGGDKRVREERKGLVRKVERELESIDERKAEVWRRMKHPEAEEEVKMEEVETETVTPVEVEKAVVDSNPADDAPTDASVMAHASMDVDQDDAETQASFSPEAVALATLDAEPFVNTSVDEIDAIPSDAPIELEPEFAVLHPSTTSSTSSPPPTSTYLPEEEQSIFLAHHPQEEASSESYESSSSDSDIDIDTPEVEFEDIDVKVEDAAEKFVEPGLHSEKMIVGDEVKVEKVDMTGVVIPEHSTTEDENHATEKLSHILSPQSVEDDALVSSTGLEDAQDDDTVFVML